jgi:hypothetical protein
LFHFLTNSHVDETCSANHSESLHASPSHYVFVKPTALEPVEPCFR